MLRYYMHLNPDELDDVEYASAFATLKYIRAVEEANNTDKILKKLLLE